MMEIHDKFEVWEEITTMELINTCLQEVQIDYLMPCSLFTNIKVYFTVPDKSITYFFYYYLLFLYLCIINYILCSILIIN